MGLTEIHSCAFVFIRGSISRYLNMFIFSNQANQGSDYQANPIHQGNQGSDSLGWEINEYKIE